MRTIFALILLISSIIATPLTVTWNVGASGTFGQLSSWVASGDPTGSDVVISATSVSGNPYFITVNSSISVNSLSLSSANAVLVINAGVTLTVSGNLNLNGGKVVVQGNMNAPAIHCTSSSTLQVSADASNLGSTSIVVDSGATLAVTGSASLDLTVTAITNNGPMSFDNEVAFSSYTSFSGTGEVHITGTMDVIGTMNFSSANLTFGPGATINAESDASIALNYAFNRSIFLTSGSNQLWFNGNISFDGLPYVTISGNVNFNGKVYIGEAHFAIAASSNLNILNTVNIVGPVNISGQGFLNMDVNSHLNVQSSTTIDAVTTLVGQVSLSPAVTLTFNHAPEIATVVINGSASSSVIVFSKGALLDVTNASISLVSVTAVVPASNILNFQQGSVNIDASSAINMSGIIQVPSGNQPAITGAGSLFVAQSGQLQVSGTLTVSSNFVNSGSINAATGGHLIVSGSGNCTSQGSIQGAGILEVQVNTWDIACSTSSSSTGTLLFNPSAAATTSFALRSLSYTFATIIVSGKSLIVNADSVGFNVTGAVTLNAQAQALFSAPVSVSGAITLNGASYLGVNGSSNILRCGSMAQSNLSSIAVAVSGNSSSLIQASGNIVVASNLYFSINGDINQVNTFTFLKFGTRVGDFSSVQVLGVSSNPFQVKFDDTASGKDAFAIRSSNTTISTNPQSSEESSDAMAITMTPLFLVLLASLFM